MPLLVVFIWLAWSGWNEYQKLEAYKIWAADFDNAKFDIYAVMGRKDRQITWGKPSRQGTKDLTTFSLDDVEEINLLVDHKLVDLDNLPSKGKPFLEFIFGDRNSDNSKIEIPFTDIPLAAKWLYYLTSLEATSNN